MIMRIALFILASATIMACSPAHFSTLKSGCAVNDPCIAGSGLLHVSQESTFRSTNKVDILLVEDTSGSMTSEQQSLASPFNGFISNLNSAGLDWRIAVTNMDVCNGSAGGLCGSSEGAQGRFMGPLGSSPKFAGAAGQYVISPTGNPSYPGTTAEQLFQNIVQRNNETAAGDERGIYAANMAIDHAQNASFFRDNSNLAIVFLSDEDERSVGGLDPSNSQYAVLENNDLPQTLINKTISKWGGAKSVLINSIIVKPNDTALYPDPNDGGAMKTCLNVQANQTPSGTAHEGTKYKEVADMTGGFVGSICAAGSGSGSFAAMLTNITGAITGLPISRTVNLAYKPASNPTVTFTPAGNAVSWTWTPGTNQVVLASRPADGTVVRVEYDFNPTAQKTFGAGSYLVDPMTKALSFPAISKPDVPEEFILPE
jgi:hypothetical protein